MHLRCAVEHLNLTHMPLHRRESRVRLVHQQDGTDGGLSQPPHSTADRRKQQNYEIIRKGEPDRQVGGYHPRLH
jgi:hypothetical protein